MGAAPCRRAPPTAVRRTRYDRMTIQVAGDIAGRGPLSDLPSAAHRRRLQLLLGAVIGGGVLVFVIATVRVLEQPRPEAWRLALAVLLGVLGNAPLLRMRIGHNGSSFNYGEGAVVLLLALLPPAWLFVVSSCAVAATQLASRQPLRKVAFNTGSFVVGLAAAEGIVYVIEPVPLSGDLTWRHLAALVLGLAVFSLFENAAVSAVVAFSQDLSFGDVASRALGVNLVVALANLAAGLCVLVLARWEWHTLLPLPAFLITLVGTYRGYVLATEARDTWQRLEVAGQDLNQLDEDSIADAVLRHAVRLFLADWVELELDAGRGLPVRHYRRDLSATRMPEPADPAADDGVRTPSSATVVALRDPGGEFGALRVGFNGPVKLSDRETQVLANFGRAVTAAVANARLYGELQIEAARKEFEANHDLLTGLANRRLLISAAQDAARRRRIGAVCGMLLLELDHFKKINDALGRSVGDRLLSRLGERLVTAVGSRGIVGRLDGHELAVLLPAVREADLELVSAELQHVLAEPISIESVRLSIEATVGGACLPTDCDTADELLQRADVALALAKASAGSYRRYLAEDDGTSLERLQTAAQLRAALAGDELVVFFQPQLDLSTGTVVGVEALTRWQHPTRGLLGPAEFIPVIEQSELVRPFTLHVLDAAVAQAAAWSRRGTELQVSVNLSARTLLDRQLPDDVATILHRHGVPAQRIVLEITETTMMSELDIVEDVLVGLHALGVELSVDDFGTGYSSLALLQRIAVNEIKVDKSFVLNMNGSSSDRTIVQATVDLGHGLGLRVVAEGVENADVLRAVRRIGCDRAQGYHVSRPMPAAALDLSSGPTSAKRPAVGSPPRPMPDLRYGAGG